MSTFLHYVHCKDALLDCSAPGGEWCESLTWVDEITREKLSKLICYIFLISQEQNSPRQELHFWFNNGNTLSPVCVNIYMSMFSSELLVSLHAFQLVEPTTSCLDCSDNHFIQTTTLLWRHNGRDGVSNHQPHNCLLNRLFGRRSKITSKSRITGLCAWNSLVTGEFSA